MKNTRSILTGTGVACLLAASMLSAQASALLTVSDGVDPVVSITDNGPGDSSPLSGVIEWSGSLGGWTYDLNVGETMPFLGNALNPQMYLDFTAISSGAGNLTITLSDTGFGPIGNSESVELGAGGTLASGGSVTVSGLINGSAVVGFGPLTTSAWNDNATTSVGSLSSFSLEEEIVLTSGASGGASSGSATLVVPEPASMALLMLGTSALWVLRKKRTA
jgi:hypothetical protein